MWRAVGSPLYTAASVACDWGGAVKQKPLAICRKRRKNKGGPTDRQSDQQTDRPTQ